MHAPFCHGPQPARDASGTLAAEVRLQSLTLSEVGMPGPHPCLALITTLDCLVRLSDVERLPTCCPMLQTLDLGLTDVRPGETVDIWGPLTRLSHLKSLVVDYQDPNEDDDENLDSVKPLVPLAAGKLDLFSRLQTVEVYGPCRGLCGKKTAAALALRSETAPF